MGGKNSKSNLVKKSFLHPNEEARILAFFGLKNMKDKISKDNLHKVWQTMLVPTFLEPLLKHLITQSKTSDSNTIAMDAMILVYTTFVRGSLNEIAGAIVDLIGSNTKSNKEVVLSYNNILKYLSDLISSYLKLLENSKDQNLMSWSAESRKFNSTAQSALVKAWSEELIHKDDEVSLYNFELWLSNTGTVIEINKVLVTSLYNNDIKTNLIPKGIATKTSVLHSTQILYLSSLLPSVYRNQWRFLFSTRTHGESFSTMMRHILHQGPTLMIIKDSKDYIFGGFASDSWSTGPKFVGNETCFLFKLSPVIKSFFSTGYNDHYMYLNSNQTSLPNGLGMGGEFGYWGLWVDYEFGLGECSESCTTFRNYVMPASRKKFDIDYIEVWGVGVSQSSTPRGIPERVSSVVDKDLTLTQMLEMTRRKRCTAGRQKLLPSTSQDDYDGYCDE